MLSFFSVDLVICWRAIIFASGVTPAWCCGDGLPCCCVAEFSFVQTALYQKAQLQTAWICAHRSESAEIVCVVCLLRRPFTLPLMWLCDDRLLCSSTVCVCTSCFQLWMNALYWMRIIGTLVGWLVFFPLMTSVLIGVWIVMQKFLSGIF